jgi:phosphoribosylformylglycinamidine cyclo-ligase
MTSANTAAGPASENTGITYASAGVDVEAGDLAVELMKDAVKATHNPSVIGGVGGFAGLYDVSKLLTYKKPLLATSTDGVGTKVAIAQAMDIHDTIGFDLVGMVVDDIVVVGGAAVHDGLHRLRQGGARAHCRHCPRHCRRLLRGRHCPGGRRNRRAPRPAGRARI